MTLNTCTCFTPENETLALTFKALGHPCRLKIVKMLAEGPLSAGELAQAFNASWPTVSRHLSILKSSGILTSSKEGQAIFYAIAQKEVLVAIDALSLHS